MSDKISYVHLIKHGALNGSMIPGQGLLDEFPEETTNDGQSDFKRLIIIGFWGMPKISL